MRFCDLIDKKKQGLELSFDELEYAVKGFIDGSIPDYQMSALLMAIYFRGMSDKETEDLTRITVQSGDVLDLSEFGDATGDKHSTGGVGDKTTLIVAPIAASLGVVVAKMSGRGLGHTGGTIDKLEAIPGLRTELEKDEFIRIAKETGICVVSAGTELAPADKKMYALRDVTSTVDSLPLIVASIMGKKLAAGSKSIVLDVKYGSGAFMKTPEDAEKLGEKMVSIGKACGRNMRAVITNMDIPLGRNIGNLCEVEEAYRILCGKSDGLEDLKEVCIELSANLVALTKGISNVQARTLADDALSSGRAFEKFKEWIIAQGADFNELLRELNTYRRYYADREIRAASDGYISKMDTEKIGLCALSLGAGRQTKESTIDNYAGITVVKKTGDKVRKGEVIAIIYSSRPELLKNARGIYLSAVKISENEPTCRNIIYKTLE